MKPPKLTLYKLANGFVVDFGDSQMVFESPDMFLDSNGDCAVTNKEVLWHIVDWMGNGNRYSSERINISIVPGDKWEPHD